MLTEKAAFPFGENWKNFVKYNFSEERVSIAQKHILDFLNLSDLHNKDFLDIGSGSGLSAEAL